MSSFDSVILHCPHCDKIITEQSKAGACELKQYHQTSVPAEIAEDLKDTKITCPRCRIVFKVAGNIPRVTLYLMDAKRGNDYDYD